MIDVQQLIGAMPPTSGRSGPTPNATQAEGGFQAMPEAGGGGLRPLRLVRVRLEIRHRLAKGILGQHLTLLILNILLQRLQILLPPPRSVSMPRPAVRNGRG